MPSDKINYYYYFLIIFLQSRHQCDNADRMPADMKAGSDVPVGIIFRALTSETRERFESHWWPLFCTDFFVVFGLLLILSCLNRCMSVGIATTHIKRQHISSDNSNQVCQ